MSRMDGTYEKELFMPRRKNNLGGVVYFGEKGNETDVVFKGSSLFNISLWLLVEKICL